MKRLAKRNLMLSRSAERGRVRLAAGLLVALCGCIASEGGGRAELPVTQELWTTYRERLAELRAGRPEKPYVERVRLGVFSPRTGRKIEARGALAVSPRKAARLVMVGPGGATALDAWVTPERYRFAIPAINKQARGGKELDDTFGVPIGFLRWWMLAPLEGELLTLAAPQWEGAPPMMILGDGTATYGVTAEVEKGRLTVIRRARGHVDTVQWYAKNLKPAPGQRGQYVDEAHHVTVDVFVEDVMPDEPDPAAFIDPDSEKGQAL